MAFCIENKHIAFHCFLLTKPDDDKIIAGTSSGDECFFQINTHTPTGIKTENKILP
jgi:hypothetical protein